MLTKVKLAISYRRATQKRINALGQQALRGVSWGERPKAGVLSMSDGGVKEEKKERTVKVQKWFLAGSNR